MAHRRKGMICSFCGKKQDQVQRLIAGPGVYICDECIGLCNEILAEAPHDPPHKSDHEYLWPRRAPIAG